MQALREHLTAMGLSNVSTYIQSGNVVFQCESDDKTQLSNQITQTIQDNHNFAPYVQILNPNKLSAAINHNPFVPTSFDPKFVHLYFLDTKPEPAADRLAQAEKLAKASETYQLLDQVFYLHAPDGIARSKLAAKVERLFETQATARNLRTTRKILELVSSFAT